MKLRRANPVAKELRTPKFSPKTEPAKKGFNSYVRKPKHGWLNTQYDLDIFYDL